MSSKPSPKNRKFKRFALKCAAYRNAGRREKNKVKRLRRHLKCHSSDGQAVSALSRLK